MRERRRATDTKAGLEIRLFGELVVARDGQPLTLPASKKTRALLAYLAATGKPQLRERLCTLLWDGPDDPRAALRWSLTKLRPLVDDDGTPRLVADRDRVELVPGDAAIDLVTLRAAIPGGTSAGVARASTEALVAVAPLVRGELLEGLDLPDCFRYDEWLRAEREAARRLGVTVLSALVERLRDTPADALDHARTWLALDPLDEAAHAAVIRVLVELDRKTEALAQYASCARLLERELGRGPSRELERLRIVIGSQTAPVPAPVATPVPALIAEARGQPRVALVGRASECATLAALLDQPRTRVVLLIGDPGMGKSRLLGELDTLAHARSIELLRGRGVEAEQVRPYGAWLDAFETASVANHPFKAANVSETDRARLFESVVEWLVDRTHGGTLVLVFDDVQWIDEATAALIHYVARSPRTTQIRIALAARAGELADNASALRLVRGLTREGAVQQIGLSPLDASETAALALAHAPGVDAARVFAESGGHPLFAVEIARALARGDTTWASLESLLVERLELVEGTARELLPWAAALGTAFSADVLGTITGLPLVELARAFEELERRAILSANAAEWDFAHDLVRAAAYHQVSEPRRRLLHLQIARALAALPDPDGDRSGQIAHHAGLGDDAALCATACLAAAERAMRLFAPEEAAALAERGLGHAVRLVGHERVRLQIGLLVTALHADVRRQRRPAIAKALERAIVDAQIAGCAAEAARGLNELAHIPFGSGDYGRARSMSLEATERARNAAPDDRARTLAYSAQCLALVGREIAEAEQLANEAAALLSQKPVDIPTLPFAFAFIRMHQGDDDAAITLLRRGFELAERAGMWWLCALGWARAALIEVRRGRPVDALPYCAALRANAVRIGEAGDIPFGAVLEAIARQDLDEPVELEPAIEALRAIDAPNLLALALVVIAERELVRGDLLQAARRSDEAVASALRSQHENTIALAHCVAAQIAAADGRLSDVRKHVDAVSAIDTAILSTRATAAVHALPRR
ncbi:MAG TPA: AAA family ATPase [Kofleriaceae bacterium]|nr:AAA family ATPase [Kofleriaceae bacterium]